MNEFVQQTMQLRIQKTINALKKNNMAGYYVKSRDELFDLLSELVPDGSVVGHGGSATLTEAGVIDWLRAQNVDFIDRARSDNPKESMKRALLSDVFFMSTNAVTEDGVLYNVDGLGNRTAAMIYGPESVIVIAGSNKIVPDINAAVSRVQKIAAPANTMRLSCETPCAKTGECAHCRSKERICCAYVAVGFQRVPERIKVIFLDESLGF
jgi:L-lactate utilization protein LutB